MEELYKDINRWIGEQRKLQQEKEIKELADILFEGLVTQLERKSEET